MIWGKKKSWTPTLRNVEVPVLLSKQRSVDFDVVWQKHSGLVSINALLRCRLILYLPRCEQNKNIYVLFLPPTKSQTINAGSPRPAACIPSDYELRYKVLDWGCILNRGIAKSVAKIHLITAVSRSGFNGAIITLKREREEGGKKRHLKVDIVRICMQYLEEQQPAFSWMALPHHLSH